MHGNELTELLYPNVKDGQRFTLIRLQNKLLGRLQDKRSKSTLVPHYAGVKHNRKPTRYASLTRVRNLLSSVINPMHLAWQRIAVMPYA
jgi:hypothetical protein